MTAHIGGFAIGTVGIPTTILSAPATVTITAPIGAVTTPTPTITWTYTSPISRPQAWYRVVVEVVGSGIVYDSGPIEGASTSHSLDYVLTSFTNYLIHVGASDGLTGGEDPIGTSGGWDSTAISGEFSDIPTALEQRVGSVYEVAINGVGYMLADNPERPVQRTTALLTPDRFASTDTPFAESIDRYSMIAFSDFTGGEGQLYLDRPRSDPSRYWYSEWVNPFVEGELSLNRETSRQVATAFTTSVREHPRLVVAGTTAYLQTNTDDLSGIASPGATPTDFATGLSGEIVGLASDGAYWYASDGAAIRRNNSAASGAEWSTVDVTEIAWCTDRLAGLDTAASPPNFTTFAPDGTEENAGGWQGFTGATLRGLCGGDGWIWFGVNHVHTGHIRAWQLGSGAGASIIALTLPEGETVDSLYFYLGNVFAATTVNDTPYDRKIYRCVPNEGVFTPQLLVTIDGNGTAAHGRTFFAGRDRFVAFSWPAMMRDDTSGIGVIDLETSGHARWQSGGETANTPVVGVATWAGDFAFVLDNVTIGGLYTSATDGDLHAGLLETSVGDLASNLTKIFDSVSLTTKPLAGSIGVSYSTTTNATWVPIGTMDGSGSTTFEIPTTVPAASFGFRLVLTPSGDQGPVVKRVAGKMHPLSLTDQVVVLPINCADQISGLNDVLIQGDSRVGAGLNRIKTLELLVGQIVLFQDVDWPRRREAQTFQLVSAEATMNGAFGANQNFRVDSGVCVVTLRRPLS